MASSGIGRFMKDVLHMISGPRNLSTAIMYSFDSRGDTQVIDEPFYACYLLQTGKEHPGREEIMASQPHTVSEVWEQMAKTRSEKQYLFIKNMAHHFEVLNPVDFLDFKNIFLIRSPMKLIASFTKVIEEPTMLDIGVEREWELFEKMRHNSQEQIAVLDSDELLKDPASVLKKLCGQLDIAYLPMMLSWEKGSRDYDGVWAKYWYHSVHKSTNFAPQPTTNFQLNERYMPLYEKAKVYYDSLFQHAIKA